jgi:hypothetical protein
VIRRFGQIIRHASHFGNWTIGLTG